MKTTHLTPSYNTPRDTYSDALTIHEQSQSWISTLRFCDDEIRFIRSLLSSYVFEPDCEKSYTRLECLKTDLNSCTTDLSSLSMDISCHENRIGGSLESRETGAGSSIKEEHATLTRKFEDTVAKYQALKMEIFNFASGILSKRRGPGS